MNIREMASILVELTVFWRREKVNQINELIYCQVVEIMEDLVTLVWSVSRERHSEDVLHSK